MTCVEPAPPPRLTGREALRTALQLDDATVLDFWQWAFSDLRMNNIRGVYAEWLVAKLLGLDLPVRQAWDPWDLQTPEGVTIEVKASGYLQSWHQKQPSKIVFSGLRARHWDAKTGIMAHLPTYNADLYAFCVHTEKDPTVWDALDLDQWRFCLLDREEMQRRNCRALTLPSIERTCPLLTAADFRVQATARIRRLPARRTTAFG